MQLEKWNEGEDGELSQETLERKLTKQGYSFTQYTFWPGCDFPDHTHANTKKDAILTGQMELVMYGQKVTLQPGDMVLIPKNTIHNARVVGNKPVIFYDSSK